MTIMRVHSVICFRSVVSESCVIVGLNPVCCRRVRPPYRREQGGSTLRGRGLANAAAPPYDQQVTTPLINNQAVRHGTSAYDRNTAGLARLCPLDRLRPVDDGERRYSSLG